MVLSTVFVVNPELGNGVVSGKYFWFYLSMGVVAIASVGVVFRFPGSIRFNRLDRLILLFGGISLPLSFCLHHSEALTKHILLAGCLYTRYPSYQAYIDWRKAEFLYQAGAYEQAGEAYAPLYPQLFDQLKFLFEYAQSLSKTGRYEESNKVLETAVRISCDPMLHNIMGKNYQAIKHYAEAEDGSNRTDKRTQGTVHGSMGNEGENEKNNQ
jgi:tetratricopeptide (TPR) repeat protein